MTVNLAERRIQLIEAPRTRCRCRECGLTWAPRLRDPYDSGWWICPAGCNAPGRLAA